MKGIILLLLIPHLLNAQVEPKDIKPLQIGDKVPNIPFNILKMGKTKDGRDTSWTEVQWLYDFLDGTNEKKVTGFAPKEEEELAEKLRPTIQRLEIGDKVPNIEFTSIDGRKFHLYDDSVKASVIVLDFWATWCGSCIVSFPKIDALQKKSKDIKYIMVNSITGEKDEEGIKKRWENIEKKYKFRYVKDVAIMDSVAEKYFPHRVLPHYVWMRYEHHEERNYYYVTGYTSSLTVEEAAKWAWKSPKDGN